MIEPMAHSAILDLRAAARRGKKLHNAELTYSRLTECQFCGHQPDPFDYAEEKVIFQSKTTDGSVMSALKCNVCGYCTTWHDTLDGALLEWQGKRRRYG